MFRPNPRFKQELKNDPGVREQIHARAKVVAGIAGGLAPEAGHTVVAEDDGQTITAGSDDPFFHLFEWGSVNNSPYAPIRRAVRAAGLDLNETGP